MGVVHLTLHLKVKYLSGNQVEELIGCQTMARQCLIAAIRHESEGESSATTKRALLQSKEIETSSDTMAEGVRCKKLEKVTIDTDVDKYFQVGVQLPPREKEELVAFLRKNVDVFT